MSKKKAEPTMDELWVMAATILAFKKAHKLSDRACLRQFERGKKGTLFERVDAFRRDPANRAAILLECVEAAEAIGRGATKQ
jgi:hypothetical protein